MSGRRGWGIRSGERVMQSKIPVANENKQKRRGRSKGMEEGKREMEMG